ncbi:hypothetical protein BH09MYX1_BH09MYX1_28710 [soil metagenome]
MSEYVALVLDWALTTATCFFLVIIDERRRRPVRLRTAVVACAFAIVAYLTLAWAAFDFFASLVDKREMPEAWPWIGALGACGFGLASTLALFVDQRRFDPAHLERSWPWTSRASAIVGFGQIAVLIHFWKTRRFSPLGLLVGFAWLAISFVPLAALTFVLGLLFPDLKE